MSVTKTFLGLLDRGPQHGYGLKTAYDELFSVGKEVRFGQVYATLSRLDRDGLAVVVAIEAGDGPTARCTRSPRTVSPSWSFGSPYPNRPTG